MPDAVRVSPSQIKRWRDCQRWWAFEKIEGKKSLPGEKAEFGTKCHGHLEQWVLHGTMFPDDASGRCAQRLAPWTASPRDDRVVVEGMDEHGKRKMFEVDDVVTGVIINGYIDLDAPPGVLHKDRPVVVDYKFTSSLKWAMSEEELKRDPQGLSYFLYSSKKYSAPEVEGRWLYSEFSGSTWEPKSRRKVEAVFRRDDPQVMADLGEVLADAAAIRDAKWHAKDAHELPPNPGACGKFGGCPFVGICERSTKQKLAALFEGAERMRDSRHSINTLTIFDDDVVTNQEKTNVNMLAKLKANAAKNREPEEKPEETEAAAPEPEEAPTEEAPPPAKSGLLASLKAKNEAKGTAGPSAEDAPEEPAEEPPAPRTNPELSKRGSYTRCAQKGCKKKALDGQPFCGGDHCANQNVVGDDEPEAEAPSKAPPAPPAPAAGPSMEDFTPPDLGIEPRPVKTKHPFPIGVLLVDAGYVKSGGIQWLSLHDFVKPAADRMKRRNKVQHWSIHPDHFVTARGELAAEVGAILDQGGHIPVLVCSSRSPEYAALEGTLVAASAVVIKGGL